MERRPQLLAVLCCYLALWAQVGGQLDPPRSLPPGCQTVRLLAPSGQRNALTITNNVLDGSTCYFIEPAAPDEIVYFNVLDFNFPPTERNAHYSGDGRKLDGRSSSTGADQNSTAGEPTTGATTTIQTSTGTNTTPGAATTTAGAATTTTAGATTTPDTATTTTAGATTTPDAATTTASTTTTTPGAPTTTTPDAAITTAGAATTTAGAATTTTGAATTTAGTATTTAGAATTTAGTATTTAGVASTTAGAATTTAGVATTTAGTASTTAGTASTTAGTASTTAGTATTKGRSAIGRSHGIETTTGAPATTAGSATTTAGAATTTADATTTTAGSTTTTAGSTTTTAGSASTTAGSATTTAGSASTTAGSATTTAGSATTTSDATSTAGTTAGGSTTTDATTAAGGITTTRGGHATTTPAATPTASAATTTTGATPTTAGAATTTTDGRTTTGATSVTGATTSGDATTGTTTVSGTTQSRTTTASTTAQPTTTVAASTESTTAEDTTTTDAQNSRRKRSTDTEADSTTKKRSLDHYTCTKAFMRYKLRNSRGAEVDSDQYCGYTRPQDYGNRYVGDVLQIFVFADLPAGHEFTFTLEYWSQREMVERNPCWERSQPAPPITATWPPIIYAPASSTIRSFTAPVGPVTRQDVPTVNAEKDCMWRIESLDPSKTLQLQLLRDSDPERNNLTLHDEMGRRELHRLDQSFKDFKDFHRSSFLVKWNPWNPRGPRKLGRYNDNYGSVSTGFKLCFLNGRLACKDGFRPEKETLTVVQNPMGEIVHKETTFSCPEQHAVPGVLYENNLHCSWQIKLDDPTGTVCLAYEFDDLFEVESDFGFGDTCIPYDCDKDNVTVQVADRRENGLSGPYYAATYVKTYCGRKAPRALTVDGRSLLFTFRSNGQNRFGGFRARVFTVTCRQERCRDVGSSWPRNYKDFCVTWPPYDKYLTGRDDHLLYKRTHLGPCVMSPCYSDPFPEYSNCTWLIRSKPTEDIELSFDRGYNLDDEPSCTHAYLDLTSDSTDKTYCGSRAMEPSIFVRDNDVMANFVSSGVRDNGFKIIARTVPTVKRCPITPSTIRVQSSAPVLLDSLKIFGTELYPDNVDCSWDISFPKCSSVSYEISLRTSPCEPRGQCLRDILYVNGQPYCSSSIGLKGTISNRDQLRGAVRFVTDHQNTGRGFVISFFGVNCRTTTELTATPQWQCFTSPNWELATGSFLPNYEPGTDCSWVISHNKPTEYEAIELKAKTMRIYGDDTQCSNDYVRVSTSTSAGKKYCDRSEMFPDPFSTTERVVTVAFKANLDQMVDKGLEMCYRAVIRKCEVSRKDTECDPIVISRGSGRWLTDEVQENYCTWVVRTVAERAIAINYDVSTLEPSGCVTIYTVHIPMPADDADIHRYMYNPVARVCGLDPPDRFSGQIDGKNIIVKLENTDLDKDFKMTLTPVCPIPPEPGRCTEPGILDASKMERTLYGPDDTIQPPRKYASGYSCEWIIRIPRGYQFLGARFTRMDVLSEDALCREDRVEMYAPAAFTRNPKTFCQKMDWTSPMKFSRVDDVRITFTSNNDDKAGDGFQLAFQLEPHACDPHPVIVLNECGGRTTIQPSLDPVHSAYYSCQDCFWIISSNKCTDYKITAKSMSLVASDCLDYVEVYKMERTPIASIRADPKYYIDSIRGGAEYKYCGTDTREINLSLGEELAEKIIVVYFHSDDTVVGNGFQLEIESSGGCCECPGSGSMEASKDIQHIQSPNYPFMYYPSQTCTYIIRVPYGFTHLEARFEKLEVAGGSSQCWEDYVSINNQRFCRENPAPRYLRYPTDERQVTVTFNSDAQKLDNGFRLAYYLVPFVCPVHNIEHCKEEVTISSDRYLDPHSPAPNTYYSCIDCLWTVQTDCFGFTVAPIMMNLDPMCEDYVSLYILPADAKPTSATEVVGRYTPFKVYCGMEDSIVIDEQHLAIIFHTDQTNDYNGFRLKLTPFTDCKPLSREADHSYGLAVKRDDEATRTVSVVHGLGDCSSRGECEILITPETPCTEPNPQGKYQRLDLWYGNEATVLARCYNMLHLFIAAEPGSSGWTEVPHTGLCSDYETVDLGRIFPEGQLTGDMVKFTYDVAQVSQQLTGEAHACNLTISYKIVCTAPSSTEPCVDRLLECPLDWPNLGEARFKGFASSPSREEMQRCSNRHTTTLYIPPSRQDGATFELRFVNINIPRDAFLPEGCNNAVNDQLKIHNGLESRIFCGSFLGGSANVNPGQVLKFAGTKELNLTSFTRRPNGWNEAWLIEYCCPESQCVESKDCNYGPGKDPYTCCIDGKCVCTDNRVLVDGKCKLAFVGGPCTESEDCQSRIPNSVCTNNRCTCRQGFTPTPTPGGETYCTKVEIGTKCAPNSETCNTIQGSFCDKELSVCRCVEGSGFIPDQMRCAPLLSTPSCHICYTSGGQCIADDFDRPLCVCPGQKFSSVGNALLTGCDRGVSVWGEPCNENCTCVEDLRCVFTPPDRKCCACPPGEVAVPAFWDPLQHSHCERIVSKPCQCEKCIERGGTCYVQETHTGTADDHHTGCVCPKHKSTSDPNDPSTDCDTEHVLVDCMKDRMVVCYNATGHWFHPGLKQALLDGEAIAYVRYHLQMPECRFQRKTATEDTYCYTVHYDNLQCGVIESHPGTMADEYRLRAVVQRSGCKNCKTQSKEDFEFHAYCRYDNMKNVKTGGLVTDIRIKGVVGRRIHANLNFAVRDGFGLDVTYSWVFLADPIKLVINLVDQFETYKAIKVMNCFASDQADLYASKHSMLLLENGCPVEYLTHQTTFRQHDPPTTSSTGLFPVFSIGTEHRVFFCCSVRVCLHTDDCRPSTCGKLRKRRSAQEEAHTTAALKNAMIANTLEGGDDVQVVTQELRILPNPRPKDPEPREMDHHRTNSGARDPGHGYRERDQLGDLMTRNEIHEDRAIINDVMQDKGRRINLDEERVEEDSALNEIVVASVCVFALLVFIFGLLCIVYRHRQTSNRYPLQAEVSEG